MQSFKEAQKAQLATVAALTNSVNAITGNPEIQRNIFNCMQREAGKLL